MAIKLMKRYSTLFVIWKMKVKNTMRRYCTLIRITKIKNLTPPDVGEDVKQLKH